MQQAAADFGQRYDDLMQDLEHSMDLMAQAVFEVAERYGGEAYRHELETMSPSDAYQALLARYPGAEEAATQRYRQLRD